MTFCLSPGQAADGPAGRDLLQDWQPNIPAECTSILMDRAYEGNETRRLACDMGLNPVVPPKKNRLQPWEYDKELYKRRNEIERLFRRLKAFRRIFVRYDKLDVIFNAFITCAFIFDALKALC